MIFLVTSQYNKRLFKEIHDKDRLPAAAIKRIEKTMKVHRKLQNDLNKSISKKFVILLKHLL